MLCSLCNDIFRTPIEFKSRHYKRSVDLHRESADIDSCYMCDCIWRSFIGDDENAEVTESTDYFTTYRFIDQSGMQGHTGLIALAVNFVHKSGRTWNPTRRYYPAFYIEPVIEPVAGQSKLLSDPRKYLTDFTLCGASTRPEPPP